MFESLFDPMPGLVKAVLVTLGTVGVVCVAIYAWCVLRHNALPSAIWARTGPDRPAMNRLNKPVTTRQLSPVQRHRITWRFLPMLSTLSAGLFFISSVITPSAAPAVDFATTSDRQVPITNPQPNVSISKPQTSLSTGDLATILEASEMKDTAKFPGNAWNNANNRRDEWLGSNRSVKPGSTRSYAVLALDDHGWSLKQWTCLDRLWWHESGWSPTGGHPQRAYGIPQAYPGSKMSVEGKDWKKNPKTQIDWGLEYIKNRYGSPCGAFDAWKDRAAQGYGWY